MSTQPTIPLSPPPPQIASPVLYIALSTKPSPLSSTSQTHPHWAFLVGPSSETPSSTGISYTYTAHTIHTATPPQRIWKHNTSHPHPLRAAYDSNANVGIIARLLIAEVSSLEALSALMRECAERDDEPVSSALSGDENDNETVEWMRAVLAKLDDDNTRGSAGGDDDDDDDDDDDEEVCRGKCLGRRMECFESVEAEGREMWGRYVGVSRAEGQEVPTRVLFDYRRIPAAVEVGEGEGESESGDGGVKGGGEGERETEMERGISSGMTTMEREAESETDQIVRAKLDILSENASFR